MRLSAHSLISALVVIAVFALAASTACTGQPEKSDEYRDGEALEEVVARLERTGQRLDSAAATIEQGQKSQAQPTTPFHPDALRLLALLSQLRVELDIVHRLIDPDVNGRPRSWPLSPDDELALTYTSSRLTWINVGLSEFLERVVEHGEVLTDESALSVLAELMTELDQLHSSVWELRHAHSEGTPIAPSMRPIRPAQAAIDELIEAVNSTPPQASTLTRRLPWGSLLALERLQWAAFTGCSALGCFADQAVAEPDLLTSGLLRYSSLEFDAAHQRSLAFPRARLADPRCRHYLAQAENVLWWVTSEWRAMFQDVRDSASSESIAPRLPRSDATKSLIYLFGEALVNCFG